MVSSKKSPYTHDQMTAWLRGLLTIAWADGNYDLEEKAIISKLIHELTDDEEVYEFHSITPEELAEELGSEPKIAENFLRTAVLVAIADGVYSSSEAELLQQFSQSLGLEIEALQALEHTLCEVIEVPGTSQEEENTTQLKSPPHPHPDLLAPLKHWLDDMDIHDSRLAHFICKMVPPQCPFERDVTLFGRKLLHIPPMCQINPLYDQLMGLRFRSLSYLADECHEDISQYSS
jgi:tellurite resistance protein